MKGMHPDIPDYDIWAEAFRQIRYSLRGMGGMSVMFHPYLCTWIVKASFSDDTQLECSHEDINVALQHLTKMVVECSK